MKPAEVKSSTCIDYIDFNVANDEEDPKFEVVDHVRTSKYKKIFAKSCNPNCSEECFMIKKAKNAVTCNTCY